MSVLHKLKILVAPLDWGLGHSTRCIPIIKHLLAAGNSVVIAGEGSSLKLLQSEFPQLQFITLKGYRVQYTSDKRLLPIKILCQIPKIVSSIYSEHTWLKQTVKQHSIDLVISDNRFGMWHRSTPSIFVTHQLQVKGPYKWIERILLALNYHHINRFTCCWVPDFAGDKNIAGKLSHPVRLPQIPVQYLGALSRLSNTSTLPLKYKLLIIISGPEPQRTIFEKTVLHELQSYKKPVLFVRGLPAATGTLPGFNNVTVQNHLPAQQLSQAFVQSEYIVARAGYTTIMDILRLQKKAILVPTPGQTEQEYLAGHLEKMNICASIPQNNFSLQSALHKAAGFAYQSAVFNMEEYKKAIDQSLENIFTTKASPKS